MNYRTPPLAPASTFQPRPRTVFSSGRSTSRPSTYSLAPLPPLNSINNAPGSRLAAPDPCQFVSRAAALLSVVLSLSLSLLHLRPEGRSGISVSLRSIGRSGSCGGWVTEMRSQDSRIDRLFSTIRSIAIISRNSDFSPILHPCLWISSRVPSLLAKFSNLTVKRR